MTTQIQEQAERAKLDLGADYQMARQFVMDHSTDLVLMVNYLSLARNNWANIAVSPQFGLVDLEGCLSNDVFPFRIRERLVGRVIQRTLTNEPVFVGTIGEFADQNYIPRVFNSSGSYKPSAQRTKVYTLHKSGGLR